VTAAGPAATPLGGVKTAAIEAQSPLLANGLTPSAIAAVESADEVVEVVRAAGAARAGLLATGCGSRVSIGWSPSRCDYALSTRGLDRVLEHRAEDMTVTVEAGVTLNELDRVLAERGQCLPFDPAEPERTTVGGLIAADAFGPLRHSTGKVRDYLLGLEVVTGSGEKLRAGGKVVKNVAGYDIGKLLVGSVGTLGVVVSATFKTRPRPQREMILGWPQASVAAAIEAALELEGAGLGAAFLEAVPAARGATLGIDGAASLLVGLQGFASDVSAQAQRLEQLSRGQATEVASALELAARALRDCAVLRPEGDSLQSRVALPPTLLAGWVDRAVGEAASRGLAIEVCAHAGIGVARIQLAPAQGSAIGLLAEWMRSSARALGGWTVHESVPAGLRRDLDPWGQSGPVVELMRGVKQVFDPAGILSPGRFVGGI